MIEFSELGFFQFDNLIKNRVSFLLINLGVSTEDWYNSVYASHLKAMNMDCSQLSPEQILNEINQRQLPQHHAIVALCKNGNESKKIAQLLQEKSYSNCYYIKGGAEGLLQEKSLFV